MKIEVLGMGCSKCAQLAANVTAAVKELTLNAEVVKVEDIETITGYGVMTMPALVIDGSVVSSGRVLTREEVKKLIAGKGDVRQKNNPGCSGCCSSGCCG